METINGFRAGGDLLRFNNGVGGQMNCQDGNCVYLKLRVVENVQTGNIHEIQSFFRHSLYKVFGFMIA